MVTRKPEHPSRHKIEVELTESELKLLAKVQECYAARGAVPSGEEALRMGLRQLADRCRPRGTNNENPKWEMTLTKAQVVEYADAYKELDSNFPGLKGESADKYISDRLEGAEDFGRDDLLKVAQWKAGKWIDHLIEDKENSEDQGEMRVTSSLGAVRGPTADRRADDAKGCLVGDGQHHPSLRVPALLSDRRHSGDEHAGKARPEPVQLQVMEAVRRSLAEDSAGVRRRFARYRSSSLDVRLLPTRQMPKVRGRYPERLMKGVDNPPRRRSRCSRRRSRRPTEAR